MDKKFIRVMFLLEVAMFLCLGSVWAETKTEALMIRRDSKINRLLERDRNSLQKQSYLANFETHRAVSVTPNLNTVPNNNYKFAPSNLNSSASLRIEAVRSNKLSSQIVNPRALLQRYNTNLSRQITNPRTLSNQNFRVNSGYNYGNRAGLKRELRPNINLR